MLVTLPFVGRLPIKLLIDVLKEAFLPSMVKHVLLVEFVGTVIDVDFYDCYYEDYKNTIQYDLPLYNPISHEMNHPYTQHKNNNRNNPKVNLMIRRIKQQQIN